MIDTIKSRNAALILNRYTLIHKINAGVNPKIICLFVLSRQTVSQQKNILQVGLKPSGRQIECGVTKGWRCTVTTVPGFTQLEMGHLCT